MAEKFTIKDRRGRAPLPVSPRLVTANVNAEMSALRSRGMALPRDRRHAAQSVTDLNSAVNDRNLSSYVAETRQRNVALAGQMGSPNTGLRKTASGDMMLALPKSREPLGSMIAKGIPWQTGDEKERLTIRQWTRAFYATHYLVSLCVDAYCRFPIQGLEFSCFSSDTPVVTFSGVVDIASLSGGSHRVLTRGGKWVDAEFSEFGEQRLYKITVRRNGRDRVFHATKEHRWFVDKSPLTNKPRKFGPRSDLTWDDVDSIRELYSRGERQSDIGEKFGISQVMVSKIVRGVVWTDAQREGDKSAGGSVKTVERVTEDLLPGDVLTSGYARNLVHNTSPSPFGVARGAVFGDGSLATSGGGSFIDLYGEKNANLLPYFSGCKIYDFGPQEGRNVSSVRVTNLPDYFKTEKPSLSESTSYLYGWLAGYFAADGTFSKKGEAFLDSVSLESISYVQSLCRVLGIKTYDPYSYVVDKTLPSGNVVKDWVGYRLSIDPLSLTAGFFVVPVHKERWESIARDRKRNENWSVVSVEETDRVETVYCAQVPDTESFVLDGDILTGNCKDPDLKKFYEQQFFEMLNWETFLIDFGREFWTVGEVNSLANFNESLGVWDAEEIINPDDLQVRYSPFERDWRYKLKVPQYLKDLQNDQDTRWEYDLLKEEYPEIIQAIQKDEGLEVSNILLKRVVNKMTPWDVYGTPHMLRTFEQLLMEQSLNAAQDAVADRLYAPLILAKLGMEDIDGSGTPWIPDAGERDSLRNDLNMALAADFRLLVHHFGLDIENVFGREAMPRLGEDYDRIERKLLQAWGIGEALVSGGTGAPYASSALNQEFVTQLMSSWQKWVAKHYRERALIVAEAQGHFDYESAGNVRVPIMEEVLEVDDDGEEYIRKRPKLLIPDLKFATINLRDENVERQFLQTLKMSGVPISDQVLMVNIPIEFDEELERVSEEKLKKLLAEARFNKKAYDLLVMQGLPIPPELQMMMAPPATPMVGPGSTAAPPGILPPGSTGQEDMAEAAAEDPTMGGAMPPGGMAAPGGAMPMMQSMPVSDITAPPPTPNLTPNMIQPPAIPGTEPVDVTEPTMAQEPGSAFLPQNWIAQRPEISDQARGNMPRKAGAADDKYIEWQDKDEEGKPTGEPRLLHRRLGDRRFGKRLREARMAAGPKHVGMSSYLTEESITDAVVNRKWAEVLTVDLPDNVEVDE